MSKQSALGCTFKKVNGFGGKSKMVVFFPPFGFVFGIGVPLTSGEFELLRLLCFN